MKEDKWVRLLPWISAPVLLLILIGVWQLIVATGSVSPFILPPPRDVATGLGQLLVDQEFWTLHVRTTLLEVVIGFLTALVAGLIAGVVLGRVLWLEIAFRPALVALQVIPKVALVPLFVIWFGFGMTTKIIIAMLLAFFPIMLNTMLGVRSVDAGHRDVMRALGTSRWKTFLHLELPSTLPYVFTGMQVAIVFAVIGAIVGEYLGGNSGLGYLVVSSLNNLDASRLFAVIVALAIMGSILFFLVNVARRIAIPWHESVMESEIA
jgi:NitT/TauT family transport system permease protein